MWISDLGVEGDGVRYNDRVREADVGVRSEPAAGAEAPAHRALLRQDHRSQQKPPSTSSWSIVTGVIWRSSFPTPRGQGMFILFLCPWPERFAGGI